MNEVLALCCRAVGLLRGDLYTPHIVNTVLNYLRHTAVHTHLLLYLRLYMSTYTCELCGNIFTKESLGIQGDYSEYRINPRAVGYDRLMYIWCGCGNFDDVIKARLH